MFDKNNGPKYNWRFRFGKALQQSIYNNLIIFIIFISWTQLYCKVCKHKSEEKNYLHLKLSLIWISFTRDTINLWADTEYTVHIYGYEKNWMHEGKVLNTTQEQRLIQKLATELLLNTIVFRGHSGIIGGCPFKVYTICTSIHYNILIL